MASRRSMLLMGGLAALLLVALALWALRDLREQSRPVGTQSDPDTSGGLQESVETSASPGGSSDSASIRDSLEYTIRDASGRVKGEGTGQ